MSSILTWLALLGPVLLLLPGLVPTRAANYRPMPMGFAVLAAAVAAAGLAAIIAGVLLLSGEAVRGGFILLDVVSATMLLLVASVGAVVVSYSCHYLDGDPSQGRFMKWLALTLAAVLMLVVSGHMLLFFAAWIATSLGLNQLLRFYRDRPAARFAARKKFFAARLGDVCLLGALLLGWESFGTLEIARIQDAARAMATSQGPSGGVHAMAALLALAAMLKSAQAPLHGWLTEVMETPTPVSALLHAGIVNAGGFLLVRFSDIIAQSAGAMDLLLLVGSATAVFGASVMLAQTSVKVSLAWSTIAQMGFMVMQCGLGAFSAALLHIVAHSFYKAHAFLSAGGVAASRRPTRPAQLPPRVLLPALAGAVGLVLAIGAALDLSPSEAPAPLVLGAVLVMSLTPTLAGAAQGGPALALRSVGIASGVALAYLALQAGAASLFGPALPPAVAPRDPFAWLLCVLVVIAFAALLALNAARREAPPSRVLQALHVHLLNGLYVNAVVNRLLIRSRSAERGI